jgi:hypothetical protein
VFPNDIKLVLGVMNSQLAQYVLKLINPTAHDQVGDLARLPIPSCSSPELSTLVEQAIGLSKADSEKNETTYDFVAPPSWKTAIDDIERRCRKLTDIEQGIDEEVHRLDGISDEDHEAIQAELAEPAANDVSDEEIDHLSSEAEDAAAGEDAPVTRDQLTRQWISYTVGIVIGRFQPGDGRALGRGHFSEDIAAKGL